MNKLEFFQQQVNDITQQQLSLLMALDKIQWKIEEIENQPGAVKVQKIFTRIEKAQLIAKQLENSVEILGNNTDHDFSICSGPSATMVHLSIKLGRLQNKFKTLQVPSNFQQSFIQQKPLNISISQKPSSFSIASCGSQENANTSLSVALIRISYLLRNNDEAGAIKEFERLPTPIQQSIYAALWAVCGRPTDNHPMAHPNFGEVSFKNREQRCQSTVEQKASAIELCMTKAQVLDIIELLKQNKNEQAKNLFLSLPAQIQGEVYGKHWEVCGKPTGEHQDESMRRIAHNDFGKVSFLGLEERCNVPSSKKVEALQACLPLLSQKNIAAQNLVDSTNNYWKSVDQESSKGYEKNNKKKESLHAFAKEILPLFLGKDCIIEIPTPPINPNTQKPSDSYVAQAGAYVEKYPCLRPFFLQLAPLKFQNETLPKGALLESPKSSQVQNPNLDNMGFPQKKQYRTNIINETLDTLNQGYYINSKNEKISFDLNPAVQSLELQTNRSFGMKNNSYNTQLFLDKQDCLTVTRDLAERGLNPIVLDAASENRFGGGYKTGAGAQEENMCRRSGLSIAADPTQGRQQNDLYPLNKHGEDAGIYVAHVPVFRGEEVEGYPYLDKPFETAVAIVPAYNFGEEHNRNAHQRGEQPISLENHNGELRLPNAQAFGTKNKLRTVLGMAEAKGHDSIVLIPLGCGAFCNPPKHVSEILMELITEEFPHSFKEIHISIIDDHNTGKTHNRRGNYIEFKETIESHRFQNQLQSNNMSLQLT